MRDNFKLIELRAIFGAIKIVREKWLWAVNAKTKEMLEDNPDWTPEKAKNEALTHPAIFEHYQPLVTLYGILGSDAEAYQSALESVVVEEEQEVRKAA